MYLYLHVVLKLFLAVVLGGVVGFERQHKSRPAGLRTHILVCIGAALVQITSIDFYYANKGVFSVDPMRMGAQVISGIGFLGAGTILKEGANIKGLTTAASIWAVACIGLAVGSGLYIEAALATIFIYMALKGLKRVEDKITKDIAVQVVINDAPGKLGLIGSALGELNVSIIDIDMQENEDGLIVIELILKSPHEISNKKIMEKLMTLDGIKKVKFI